MINYIQELFGLSTAAKAEHAEMEIRWDNEEKINAIKIAEWVEVKGIQDNKKFMKGLDAMLSKREPFHGLVAFDWEHEVQRRSLVAAMEFLRKL